MIHFVSSLLAFLTGFGCGVLLARAREHDRARQKLRDQYELERKTAPSPYRSPGEQVVDRCTCDLTSTWGSCAFCERPPEPAPAKQQPAKTFRFRGTCSRCGSFRVYELGDVDDNDNYVKCNACESRKVFHFAHNRIKD